MIDALCLDVPWPEGGIYLSSSREAAADATRIYYRRIPAWIFGVSILAGLYLCAAQRV